MDYEAAWQVRQHDAAGFAYDAQPSWPVIFPRAMHSLHDFGWSEKGVNASGRFSDLLYENSVEQSRNNVFDDFSAGDLTFFSNGAFVQDAYGPTGAWRQDIDPGYRQTWHLIDDNTCEYNPFSAQGASILSDGYFADLFPGTEFPLVDDISPTFVMPLSYLNGSMGMDCYRNDEDKMFFSNPTGVLEFGRQIDGTTYYPPFSQPAMYAGDELLPQPGSVDFTSPRLTLPCVGEHFYSSRDELGNFREPIFDATIRNDNLLHSAMRKNRLSTTTLDPKATAFQHDKWRGATPASHLNEGQYS